ncbi:MAG: NADH-quinone oxidoreductase subunit NuoB [Deltaproteobacteria bacterium]|nr:NADH-quinone oxidoreductase subunit NuoB [Deltaproteobacteria bacterium]
MVDKRPENPGGDTHGLDQVVITTKLNPFIKALKEAGQKTAAWARRSSLFPYTFGTACCGIELMAYMASYTDAARFGAEVVRFSPRQADCMIVAGTITDKQVPILKMIYDQMLEPKYVISMGVCACTGGFYRAYHVVQGIDEFIPVDVYVAGCPPAPESLLYGLMRLQERIDKEGADFNTRERLKQRMAEVDARPKDLG